MKKLRKEFLETIEFNIRKFGFHVTMVNSGVEPRYGYSIGLTSLFNLELVFAGGSYFFKDDLDRIFEAFFNHFKKGGKIDEPLEISGLGLFTLIPVHASWNKLMMLGIYDYYNIEVVNTFQIISDKNHYTMDIPNMEVKFDGNLEPVWKWLNYEWDYFAPANSVVTTNMKALFGETITEIMRWENTEWEMFAGPGPDVEEDDMRVVSLATILGIDNTVLPSLHLPLGKGLWRTEKDEDWNSWG
jgi:hypothetical protein